RVHDPNQFAQPSLDRLPAECKAGRFFLIARPDLEQRSGGGLDPVQGSVDHVDRFGVRCWFGEYRKVARLLLLALLWLRFCFFSLLLLLRPSPLVLLFLVVSLRLFLDFHRKPRPELQDLALTIAPAFRRCRERFDNSGYLGVIRVAD